MLSCISIPTQNLSVPTLRLVRLLTVDFQTVKTITMVPAALRSAVPIVQALATKSTEPAPLVRRATKECTASQKQNQTVCIQYMYMYQE